MQRRRALVTIVAIALAAAAVAAAQAPAARPSGPGAAASRLPAPILTAFQAAYPHATIKATAEEKESGKVVWEVESTEGGLGRDLLYSPDGSLVEIEEEVPSAQLPSSVRAAVKAIDPTARIVRGEKVTRGATVTYELQLGGGRRKSVALTPQGKPVASK